MSRIAGIFDILYDESIKNALFETMQRPFFDNYDAYELRNGVMLCCSTDKQVGYLNWEGERYRIIFDGELYNADELSKDLNLLGHELLNSSDAEIVMHAYAQWGTEAPERLLGVFTFAVWCEREKKLFLARDKMGVRPLFYAIHAGGLIFASEIKTILSYNTMRAQLDREGIAQVMLIGPGRVPGSGVFKGINELEPGCCAVYHDKKLITHRYWTLKDREHTESFEKTAEYVRWLVKDSILRQTQGDETVGAFLSGGLDSSIISAVYAQKLAECGCKLKTFSVDYVNNDQNFIPGSFQPERDNSYIELMQSVIQSEHHWTVLSPKDLIECLDIATCARDLPGMGDVDFSLLVFCDAIKKHVPVALSGECADEIFGGYPWFADLEINPQKGFPWSQNIEFRASFINDSISIDAKEYVFDIYNRAIGQCDILPENTQHERRIKQMTVLNQYWFMQTLIDRNDRMSMHSGLNIRAPFCDARIASYMYGVPWEMKRYGDREKGLLRYAMRDVLPNEILWRKKSPYPKTYDPAYSNLIKKMLGQMLEDHSAPIWELVERRTARNLTELDLQCPWYGQLMKGPQTMAYLLQINLWLKKYNIDLV